VSSRWITVSLSRTCAGGTRDLLVQAASPTPATARPAAAHHALRLRGAVHLWPSGSS